MPLIQLDPRKGFSMHEDAIAYLNSIPSVEFGILSVVGRYRTGKSYLLNKLLLNSRNSSRSSKKNKSSSYSGFKVGPTINPCTKGLWLLKHIFYFSRSKA